MILKKPSPELGAGYRFSERIMLQLSIAKRPARRSSRARRPIFRRDSSAQPAEQPDQQDDRNRDSDQPKQQAAAHVILQRVLLTRQRAPDAGVPAHRGLRVKDRKSVV